MTGKNDFRNEFFEKLRGKKPKKDQLLIALLVGILLLVIAMPGGEKEGEKDESSFLTGESEKEPLTEEEYIACLEGRLEHILSEMDGAGEVSVMITLAESKEKVLEKDTQETEEQMTENDSQGGNRETRNTNRSESAVQDETDGNVRTPYVKKELSPKVEGVVVIAPGGDDAVTVKNITEAVQALFGIDTHKIRIVKGRREA